MSGAAAETTPAPAVLELQVSELLDALGSREGLLASGVASALVAAMSAELVAAAAHRSGGEWEDARGAAAQARALRLRIAPLAAADARAYGEATALLELRDPSAASPQRDHLLGRALERAAEVPLRIAEGAADVAALAAEVAEHGIPRARADAAAAAVLAHAAARAAAHLVRVNLGATERDRRVDAADAAASAAAAAAKAALALE